MQSMSTRWQRIHVSGRMRASLAHTLPPNSFLERICEPCQSTSPSMFCQPFLCTGTAHICTATNSCNIMRIELVVNFAGEVRLPLCATGKLCFRRTGWQSGPRCSRVHFAAAPFWASTAHCAGAALASASKPPALPLLLSLLPPAGQVAPCSDKCCPLSHILFSASRLWQAVQPQLPKLFGQLDLRRSLLLKMLHAS